jgi:hypothetical protein
MYGLFWCRIGIGWFLYFILWDWIYALKVVAGIGLLLGQPVITCLGIPNSIPAHWQNLSILLICSCMDLISFEIMARSSTHAAEFIVYCDVLSWKPRFPRSSHLNRGSKNMIKSYGLSVSPCMVPLCMYTGFVLPKYIPKNLVDEFE